MVQIENQRGNKLGMGVGTARGRVVLALFMYVYGIDAVILPQTTSPELDVLVNNVPVSIKTKTGKGNSGVKLIWTVDWKKVNEFVENYVPSCHILFVQIDWKSEFGGMFQYLHKNRH